MIKVQNLDKSFDKPVLKDISFNIDDNSIVGLVGINGAGKSTLLRLLTGVLKQDNGSITYDGKEVYDNPSVKSNIFFLPDDPFYDRGTTIKSILDIYKVFYTVDESVYFSLINRFKLPTDKKLFNFSKGMRRQVFIALALAIKPEYLFLDEAFDGLDPLARLTVKREMIKIQEESKMTIIISSHSLRELEDICDSYLMIDNRTISSYGEINKFVEKYHKYQIAFKEIPSREMFKDIDFISYEQDQRIIFVVTRLNYEDLASKMAPFNPLIIDEKNIDFEEQFIIEVESRGYLE